MTRRIILHIGSPKCGSTYLQKILLRNQARLRSAGISYPHESGANPQDGGVHPGNAANLADITADWLEQEFSDGIHTLFLSHEDLYGLPGRGEPLARLSRQAGIEVQLVAFLRPFSEFVFGDYSQFMKQHFETFLKNRTPFGGQSFDAFALRRVNTLKPATFLLGWQSYFPATPLILASHRQIRPVLTELLGSDARIDWSVPTLDTNPSLRVEDCDRIAAAMRDPTVSDNEIRNMFRKAFHRTSWADAGRTEARRNLIETHFSPQNQELMTYFGFDNTLSGSAS